MERPTSVIAYSRTEPRHIPAGWKDTELTKFLALLEDQMLASFAGLPQWFEMLGRIDHFLTEKAPIFFHEIDEPRRTSVALFMRSFATYRAAVRLAVSGQLFETTVLLRSIVESAVYAWVCTASAAHRAAWEGRHQPGGRQVTRDYFAWGKMLALLANQEPQLAAVVRGVYDNLIDEGAHPNVEGLGLSSVVKNVGGDRWEVSTIFTHGREAVVLAMLGICQCMHIVANLLYLVIRERLQILNLDTEFQKTNAMIVALIGQLDAELQKQQD